MPIAKATAGVVLKVTVRCDRCVQQYSYSHVVTGYGKASFVRDAEKNAHDQARRAAQRHVEHKDVGQFACPACSHVQAWMSSPKPPEATGPLHVEIGQPGTLSWEEVSYL